MHDADAAVDDDAGDETTPLQRGTLHLLAPPELEHVPGPMHERGLGPVRHPMVVVRQDEN